MITAQPASLTPSVATAPSMPLPPLRTDTSNGAVRIKKPVVPAMLSSDLVEKVEKRLYEVLQEVSDLRAENQDLCKRIRLLEERESAAQQEPVVGSNLDAMRMSCLEAFLFN
jgi:hypothetical protein